MAYWVSGNRYIRYFCKYRISVSVKIISVKYRISAVILVKIMSVKYRISHICKWWNIGYRLKIANMPSLVCIMHTEKRGTAAPIREPFVGLKLSSSCGGITVLLAKGERLGTKISQFPFRCGKGMGSAVKWSWISFLWRHWPFLVGAFGRF